MWHGYVSGLILAQLLTQTTKNDVLRKCLAAWRDCGECTCSSPRLHECHGGELELLSQLAERFADATAR